MANWLGKSFEYKIIMELEICVCGIRHHCVVATELLQHKTHNNTEEIIFNVFLPLTIGAKLSILGMRVAVPITMSWVSLTM